MINRAIFLFAFVLISHVGFSNSYITTNDSSVVKKRIRSRGKVCRQLFKKRVIYKLNADTLLLLGRNRAETIVGYVGIEDSKNNESKIFIYDSSGLFSVTVRERLKSIGSKKGKVCYYVFEQGVMVWKIEEELARDTAQLLREAAFLRDYVGPFRTSLR